MELFESLTDDQTAILGCVFLFVASGILLTVSYYVGQITRRAPQPQAETVRSMTPVRTPADHGSKAA